MVHIRVALEPRNNGIVSTRKTLISSADATTKRYTGKSVCTRKRFVADRKVVLLNIINGDLAAASHYPETLNVSRILILEEEEARARADVVIHGRRVCTRTEQGPEKSVASHTIYCTTITAATNKSKTERRFNPNVRFKDIREPQEGGNKARSSQRRVPVCYVESVVESARRYFLRIQTTVAKLKEKGSEVDGACNRGNVALNTTRNTHGVSSADFSSCKEAHKGARKQTTSKACRTGGHEKVEQVFPVLCVTYSYFDLRSMPLSRSSYDENKSVRIS
uniref:Uncharacterized protein n=1 Tax=Vespula pensylvanica TaxID=30213 RepID=A0A834KQF4_VESPE|nr:hypothetical protein H0235_013302 [Vespula pensylvanica]